jgi:hypothetical protein
MDVRVLDTISMPEIDNAISYVRTNLWKFLYEPDHLERTLQLVSLLRRLALVRLINQLPTHHSPQPHPCSDRSWGFRLPSGCIIGARNVHFRYIYIQTPTGDADRY